jgi:hypothetical protein
MAKTTTSPSELNCGIPRYGELAGSDHERDDEGFWCRWEDVWPVLMAYDARAAAAEQWRDKFQDARDSLNAEIATLREQLAETKALVLEKMRGRG